MPAPGSAARPGNSLPGIPEWCGGERCSWRDGPLPAASDQQPGTLVNVVQKFFGQGKAPQVILFFENHQGFPALQVSQVTLPGASAVRLVSQPFESRRADAVHP